MTGSEPTRAPHGITVETVDWLPSGARSGIVRVQGRREAGAVADLPRLVIGERRFESLPDGAGAIGDAWRGAFVVEAEIALAATELRLEWPSGERHVLQPMAPAAPEPTLASTPRLAIVDDAGSDRPGAAPIGGDTAGRDAAGSDRAGSAPTGAAGDDAGEGDAAATDAVGGGGAAGAGSGRAEASVPASSEGGAVVDRAVLAERRAGRAEAALDRQATVARDALAAVEALELRAAALARDLEAVRAERDSLRGQVKPEDPSAPGPRETALERALAEREAEAQRLRAELDAQPAGPDHVDAEAERRAAALTQALTEAVAEVDALRAELHEQLVLRRTRDVAAGADRVALEALVREVEALRAAADAARVEAATLTADRDAARVEARQRQAETDGAHAAHDETRRRFTERVGELRAARERIATLEAELAAARRDAEQVARIHDDRLEALRHHATDDAQRAAERLAAAEARAARAEGEAAALPGLRERARRAEADLRRAEAAREAAVASALAANAQRRAAAVRDAEVDPRRVAELEGELVSLRARLAAVTPAEPAVTPPITVPTALIARAADQVRAAHAHQGEAAAGARMVANLDAAAAALRAARPPAPADPAVPTDRPTASGPAAPAAPTDSQAPADPPASTDPPAAAGPPVPAETAAPADPAVPAEAPAPDGIPASTDLRGPAETPPAADGGPDATADGPAGADVAPDTAPTPPRRQVTSEFAQLPGGLARGRAGRAYPPLRGALVRFAHDDPAAAARLIEGLAPALAAVVADAPSLDLSLATLDGTVAVDGERTRRLGAPRGRGAAKVHVRTDPVTLAETLAGVGPAPRRRGPLRALRGARRARALAAAVAASQATMPQLAAAGARIDPALALRAFAYAVPGAWTRGHAFTVNLTVDGASTGVHVADGAGIAVGPPAARPDLTVELDQAKFDALLTGTVCDELRDPPLAVLREWAVQLGALAA